MGEGISDEVSGWIKKTAWRGWS